MATLGISCLRRYLAKGTVPDHGEETVSSGHRDYDYLEWIDWFNNRRLLEPIGDIPPAEYEMIYWTESDRTNTVGLTELSLH